MTVDELNDVDLLNEIADGAWGVSLAERLAARLRLRDIEAESDEPCLTLTVKHETDGAA